MRNTLRCPDSLPTDIQGRSGIRFFQICIGSLVRVAKTAGAFFENSHQRALADNQIIESIGPDGERLMPGDVALGGLEEYWAPIRR